MTTIQIAIVSISVAATIIAIVVGGTLAGMDDRQAETDRITACVSNGGEWKLADSWSSQWECLKQK